jgi:hypothetical protein
VCLCPSLIWTACRAFICRVYAFPLPLTQVVSRLRGTLPVVVVGETWEDTGEELDDLFIGDAEL